MKDQEKTKTRYVGIDLGKRTYEVAIVGKGGKVTKSNGKTFVSGRQSLYKKLHSSDKVALEAGNMAFNMAKEIEASVGCRVYVLNPSQLAVIYSSMKKTDKEDALKLAHIIEDCKEERLPLVPVPSDKEMGRRKILASYRRAKSGRNRE
ncbi:MAG: transposase, partial [Treponema sp.]|nr:transposase [Treponema sp.]